MSTWVAEKRGVEVDNFDFEADSAVFWKRKKFASRSSTYENNCAEWTEIQLKDRMRWQRYRDSAAKVCNKSKFFFTEKGCLSLDLERCAKGIWLLFCWVRMSRF